MGFKFKYYRFLYLLMRCAHCNASEGYLLTVDTRTVDEIAATRVRCTKCGEYTILYDGRGFKKYDDLRKYAFWSRGFRMTSCGW